MHEYGATTAWRDGALYVSGEIDHDSCGVLRQAIADHIVNGRITLDLEHVAFCDSSCVQCLLSPCKWGVVVVVRRPSAAVRRVLQIVGADKVLEIQD